MAKKGKLYLTNPIICVFKIFVYTCCSFFLIPSLSPCIRWPKISLLPYIEDKPIFTRTLAISELFLLLESSHL